MRYHTLESDTRHSQSFRVVSGTGNEMKGPPRADDRGDPLVPGTGDARASMEWPQDLLFGGNRLLSVLPSTVLDRLRPDLEPVSLAAGEVIHDAGQAMEWHYFPTTAVIAMVYTVRQGTTTETGCVGNTGVTGLARLLGSSTTPNEAVVAIGGDAFRIRPRTLLAEFDRSARLRRLVLRYAQAMIIQISQTAVCNRLHHVDMRFCRWLLLARDCAGSDNIGVTQEFVAHMLGVRRECISHAAHRLQDAGLLRNRRGRIAIIDPAGLERAACECYDVVRREFDRMLDEGAME